MTSPGMAEHRTKIRYDNHLMSEIQKSLQVLGVEPHASPDEISQAYKDLIRVWHPDRLESDPELQARAQEKLKEITRAYEVLKASKAGSRTGTAQGPYGSGSSVGWL